MLRDDGDRGESRVVCGERGDVKLTRQHDMIREHLHATTLSALMLARLLRRRALAALL